MPNINSGEKSKYGKNSYITVSIFAIFIILFILWEVFDFSYTKHAINQNDNLIRSNAEFSLINPRVVKYQLPDLAERIVDDTDKYINTLKESNKITEAGFFVRDLDSGYGFGVNEDHKFVPASLLKVITMSAYLKYSETDGTILSKSLTWEGPNTNHQSFMPKDPMVSGKSYTIEDLIKRAVSISDNNANQLLMNNIDPNVYRSTLTSLGIEYPRNPEQETTSPRIYAGVFRALYNSSYLDQKNSQYALQLLSEANFDVGIQAGLNGSVKLANKFGERVIEHDGVVSYYLHDCGIIYTKHPYIICIMTEGDNEQNLLAALGTLSQMIYQSMKY